MKAHCDYREANTPWLTEIPTHWGLDRIGLHFLERKTKVSDTDYPPLSVTKKGIMSQLEKVAKTKDGDNRKLVIAKDFVINSRSDRRGSSGVSSADGSVSLINIVLTPYDIVPQWCHYLFRSHAFIEEYYRNGRGIVADLWTTRYSEMRGIFIPIPPLDEQTQIARFLDWKATEINHLIRQKRREIARLTELANTQIRNVVFGGLQGDAQTKDSGINWVGEIPDHWDVRVLFELAAEQSISNKTVHNQNLLSLSYGKIVNKDINTMDGLLPASYDTYQIVNDGNVIMRLTDLQNDKRSLRVGIATQIGIITSAYTCLKARSGEILPHYLYLLLHSYDICKVFYSMGGGVRQSIGYGEIKRVPLPLPPVEEQQAIVDYCYSLRTDIERLIAEVKNEIALITEYRTRMISDVVTGKVDVRGIEVPDLSAEDTIEEEADDAEMDDEGSTDEIEEVEENADD
jgi:type I restriction enzyme S subunit